MQDSFALNAMIPGQVVSAVFGMIEIKNFDEVTEVLQDKTLVFVNKIAEIVHGFVDEFHGAPNKNTGPKFLVVWNLTTLAAKIDKEVANDFLAKPSRSGSKFSKSNSNSKSYEHRHLSKVSTAGTDFSEYPDCRGNNRTTEDDEREARQLEKQEKLVDMSLMSFAKIAAAIQKAHTLAEYRCHPGLQQRIQNYKVF